MSPKEHSFIMINDENNVPSVSNIPTSANDHDTLRTDNSFSPSPSHTTPKVHFPQRPLQAHLHCYPPVQSVDTPSRSFQSGIAGNSSEEHLPLNILEQSLNTVANAALSAALFPDAGMSPRIFRDDNEQAAENLPLPVTAANGSKGDHVTYALLLLTFGIIVAVHVFT